MKAEKNRNKGGRKKEKRKKQKKEINRQIPNVFRVLSNNDTEDTISPSTWPATPMFVSGTICEAMQKNWKKNKKCLHHSDINIK